MDRGGPGGLAQNNWVKMTRFGILNRGPTPKRGAISGQVRRAAFNHSGEVVSGPSNSEEFSEFYELEIMQKTLLCSDLWHR